MSETTRTIVDIERDWRGAGEYMSGHYAAEFIRVLRTGFMRCVQASNQCPQTGTACRDHANCGCNIEMQEWCKP